MRDLSERHPSKFISLWYNFPNAGVSEILTKYSFSNLLGVSDSTKRVQDFPQIYSPGEAIKIYRSTTENTLHHFISKKLMKLLIYRLINIYTN